MVSEIRDRIRRTFRLGLMDVAGRSLQDRKYKEDDVSYTRSTQASLRSTWAVGMALSGPPFKEHL